MADIENVEHVEHVELRFIEESDHDTLFDLMRDPESVRMAAFVARDPNDREAFEAHMARLSVAPDVIQRAVTRDGRLLGSIGSFVIDGDREITYWIDRSAWGRGAASQALALFLDLVTVRPLFARAASDNAGSIRVLQKAGFVITHTDTGYAAARDAHIEETCLRLG